MRVFFLSLPSPPTSLSTNPSPSLTNTSPHENQRTRREEWVKTGELVNAYPMMAVIAPPPLRLLVSQPQTLFPTRHAEQYIPPNNRANPTTPPGHRRSFAGRWTRGGGYKGNHLLWLVYTFLFLTPWLYALCSWETPSEHVR